MIYLDNSASSLKKPKEVYMAMVDCMKNFSANPGRSGHKLSLMALEKIYECRNELCSFFNGDDTNKFIFTQNATEALNTVIKGALKKGDHVIFTQMEHNSVIRPIYTLEKQEISHTMVKADIFGKVNPLDIKNAINENTKLIIVTHASNVSGTVNDIKEIGKIAKENNILFLVDAAQSAGILPIDIKDMNIDFLAVTGHKALLGPQGTGALYVGFPDILPLKEGGTGSNSKNFYQPNELPDKFESGTLNTVGICGLTEGIKFIKKVGINKIFEHEMHLTKQLLENLSVIKNVNVHGYMSTEGRIGVVSITIKDKDCAMVSEILNSTYNIATRSGYHCAYNAHCALKTHDTGTIRISIGAFNTLSDINCLCASLNEIAKWIFLKNHLQNAKILV